MSAQGDDALFAAVAAVLAKITHETGWERTTLIGKLILDAFFDGSMDLYRLKAPKDNSLRRLAARADCPLKKSALAQSVAVYAFASQHASVRASGHLTPSHVVAVLGCSEGDRVRLLAEAEAERLAVRELAERAKKAQADLHARRGVPLAMRAVSRCGPSMEQVLESLPVLDDAGASEAQRVLERLETDLVDGEQLLESVLNAGEEPKDSATQSVHDRATTRR